MGDYIMRSMECSVTDCNNPAWKTVKCLVEVNGNDEKHDVRWCQTCYIKQLEIELSRLKHD